MTSILVIDDLREFTRKPLGTVYAKNVSDGLDYLSEAGIWDEIYLDHDLGDNKTIAPCVAYITSNVYKFAFTRFYIITSNPAGAIYIKNALDDAYLQNILVDFTDVQANFDYVYPS